MNDDTDLFVRNPPPPSVEEETSPNLSDTEPVLGDFLDKSLRGTGHRRADPDCLLLPLTITLLTRLFSPDSHESRRRGKSQRRRLSRASTSQPFLIPNRCRFAGYPDRQYIPERSVT